MLCGSIRRKRRDVDDVYAPLYRGGGNLWAAGPRGVAALVEAHCANCGHEEKIFRRRSGLENVTTSGCTLRPNNSDLNTPRIDSYRFSMANLEDSQDVDLDAILGELNALESQYDAAISAAPRSKRASAASTATDSRPTSAQIVETRAGNGPLRTHSRSNSDGRSDTEVSAKSDGVARTDSPDNDSAFSDTVSMLSSESSASSGGSGGGRTKSSLAPSPTQMDQASRVKAEKIRIALEKMKEASVKKLFIKTFTADGSAKSLLVDEKMTCGYVTRLLADKNHVQLEPKWGVVEHLPDLYMERVYEDHELLVDNLMMWTRDSKNRLLFSERSDRTQLFTRPERFLLSHTDTTGQEHDEHSRNMLLEEFFSSTGVGVPEVEGPLYLKADSKKGWKKHHFVLRASGLYYYPKEKAKSSRDLVCLATFDVNQVYYGVGWKKKYKAPTDFCFAVKHPRLQQPKSTKYIKFLCAEDQTTLQRWMMGIRLAKFGRRVIDDYRALMDDIAQEDLDRIAHARSCSVSSIAPGATDAAAAAIYARTSAFDPDQRSDVHSRASSSSSSGCLSDGISEAAFESDFPSGTIKRKPSMNPKLPLTSMTRQLKEVGETVDTTDDRCQSPGSNSSGSGTLTRGGVLRPSRRRSSAAADDATLKRHVKRGSADSAIARPPSSGASTPVRADPPSPAVPSEAKLAATISALEAKLSSMAAEKVYTTPERKPSVNGSLERKPAVNGSLEHKPAVNGSLERKEPKIYSGRRWTPSGSLEKVLNQASNRAQDGSQSYEMHLDHETLPPPPPPEMFESTLSLDSLPPPPPPSELPIYSDHGGSSLSLMSLPPPPSPSDSLRRRTPASSASTTPTNIAALSPATTPTRTRQCFSPPPSPRLSASTCLSPPPSPRLVALGSLPRQTSADGHIVPPYLAELKAGSPLTARKSSLKSSSVEYVSAGPKSPILKKTGSGVKSLTKKISFNFAAEEVEPVDRKPLPPKRSESTRLSANLSSPKKLSDADSELTPPPKDFLKDLQRVMRKKWQVAQKCKSDTTTTPHEVLGFRDPPPPIADYRETNVCNWVQEHYGERDNLYENVYLVNGDPSNPKVQEALYGNAATVTGRPPVDCRHSSIASMASKKRPPPLPPKRSETTHLSTARIN